ncbi:hypothetical protein HK102_006659 [Quaeritorhiza haematococci]|nr:hypothetical protein HK102_006659 [Quaeritorhiza haematococci]
MKSIPAFLAAVILVACTYLAGGVDARAINGGIVDRSVTPHIDDYFHYATLVHHSPLSLRRFAKRDSLGEFQMDLPYRNFVIRLNLRPNEDLFMGRDMSTLPSSINPRHFLKGQIQGVPNSHARLRILGDGDRVEGTIYLGSPDLGTLHIDCANRYAHATGARMVVYHGQLDVKPHQTPRGAEVLQKAAELRKRQEGAATTDATTTTAVEVSPAASATALVDPATLGKVLAFFAEISLFIKEQVESASATPTPTTTIETTTTTTAEPTTTTLSLAEPSPTPEPSPSPSPEPSPSPSPEPSPSPAPEQPLQPQQPATPQNNCKVALIADKDFADTHRNEPGGVEAYMAGMLNEISGLYLDQLNIAMSLAFSFVDRDGTARCGLNDLPNDSRGVVPAVNRAVARGCIAGLNPDEMCLIHILSSKQLDGAAVGVAFIGTVCEGGANAGISTDRDGQIPRRDLTAIFMHEMAHTLGSGHDQPGGNCDNGQGQRFVMFPSVQSGPNRLTFSECSKRDIQTNLQSPERQCMFPSPDGSRQRFQLASTNITEPRMVIDTY